MMMWIFSGPALKRYTLFYAEFVIALLFISIYSGQVLEPDGLRMKQWYFRHWSFTPKFALEVCTLSAVFSLEFKIISFEF
jgi:hypothetical protein